jgi:hypothetical protein
MIGSAYIASMRHNDNGLLNMSGLNDYLVSILGGLRVGQTQRYPALYGDGIFSRLATIVPRYRNPTEEEERKNFRMSALRIFIEHLFRIHDSLFQAVHEYRRLRFRNGEHTYKHTLMSFFVWNCYQSMYNSFNAFNTEGFEITPPDLETYLPLDENLAPGPDIGEGLTGQLRFGPSR